MHEESCRKLRTRNIEYTREQMESYRMRKIYNATGTKDYINADFVESYVFECCKFNGIPLVDIVSNDTGMIKLSVVVFEDTWSRNIYAVMHGELFNLHAQIKELFN